MRRVVLSALIVATAALVVSGIAGDSFDDKSEGPPLYTIELDNAFGLVTGADVKVGGVEAGIVHSIDLDMRTRRALVKVELQRPGFDSLRADAFCETRPQSLIGEYSLNCETGRSPRELPARRLPVEQTGSAIALDLVNNVMRRPVRERLRLILGELGAGVAGRAPELNAAIRRAVPALRQTNRVLEVLAEENRTLEQLVRDADRVLDPLAAQRREVTRFVREAGDLSETSADRREALAEQWRRLPGFLDEAEPAMRNLGRAADAQAGALEQAAAGADELTAFFGQLEPFAETSRPALRALGKSSATGTPVVRAARPVAQQLGRLAEGLPELSGNLAIILEHLDDRDNAVEPDARSPEGKGYTGLEAFLMYVFNQSNAINIFDANNHILKANLLEAEACAPWADAKRAREHMECNSWLGPNQPGILSPDFTAPKQEAATRTRRARGHADRADTPAATPAAQPSRPGARAPAPAGTPAPGAPELPALPQVELPLLGELGVQRSPAVEQSVLDYLLGS
jgi:ABC-type transporter Mla subunit MlaD